MAVATTVLVAHANGWMAGTRPVDVRSEGVVVGAAVLDGSRGGEVVGDQPAKVGHCGGVEMRRLHVGRWSGRRGWWKPRDWRRKRRDDHYSHCSGFPGTAMGLSSRLASSSLH